MSLISLHYSHFVAALSSLSVSAFSYLLIVLILILSANVQLIGLCLPKVVEKLPQQDFPTNALSDLHLL